MTLWGRIMNGIYAGVQSAQAGWLAARRVFEEPETGATGRSTVSWNERQAAYSLLWSYYSNSLFDRGSSAWNVWTAYKSMYTLYRNIRVIYNPTRRLVDFYAGQVYPGVLPPATGTLPDGLQPAIPLSPDTPPRVLTALCQFWQWTNWQALKSVVVRYGAALGSTLVEVVDDLERGKITADVIWPGFVRDLVLDAAGNVKAYSLEYLAEDPLSGQLFTYRKDVDGQGFRYYHNEEPAGSNPNPYGFVPAVWMKHTDTGSKQGSPAIAGSLGKIDEVNGLVSHVHDQIHKVIGAPVVLWSSGSLQNLFATASQKRGATEEMSNPEGDREQVLMLKGPADGRVDSLAGNLSLGDAITYVDRLLGEIEQDHPELVFYRELRSMSQVTGPAASRLVGDVSSRVSEAAAQYDVQCIKLFQMALAIGGMRASGGAWGRSLSRQQQAFAPFNLDSYERGDLDITILPRPILTPTRLETAQEKQALWTGVEIAVKAGVSLEAALLDEGWTPEELKLLEQYAPPPPPTPIIVAGGPGGSPPPAQEETTTPPPERKTAAA